MRLLFFVLFFLFLGFWFVWVSVRISLGIFILPVIYLQKCRNPMNASEKNGCRRWTQICEANDCCSRICSRLMHTLQAFMCAVVEVAIFVPLLVCILLFFCCCCCLNVAFFEFGEDRRTRLGLGSILHLCALRFDFSITSQSDCSLRIQALCLIAEHAVKIQLDKDLDSVAPHKWTKTWCVVFSNSCGRCSCFATW